MKIGRTVALAMAGCVCVLPARANDFLKNLPADSWHEIPDTRLRSVCAPENEFPTVRAVGGCASVMAAWSGGAYDAGRKRLWIFGGGHMDYWGNELYAFDIESLKWSRATSPTVMSDAKASADPLPEGAPISRHTYDGLAFLGSHDRLFAYGGSMAGNGYGTTVTWTFAPDGKKWENRKPTGDANHPQTNCCNFSGEYDPATGKVFMRDPDWICAYDAEANAWSHVHEQSHTWGPGKAVIDTKRHLLFTLGSGEFLAYDIGAGKDVTGEWKTTGGDSILNAYGVGAAYDGKADRIVAWAGKGIYVLDMASKAWSVKGLTGGPAGQLENGTYGRFRYVPDDNVFVLANGVDANVWIYKLTAGGATGLRERAGKSGPRAPMDPFQGRRVDGRIIRPTGRLPRHPPPPPSSASRPRTQAPALPNAAP
jgi:hypothetical protein